MITLQRVVVNVLLVVVIVAGLTLLYLDSRTPSSWLSSVHLLASVVSKEQQNASTMVVANASSLGLEQINNASPAPPQHDSSQFHELGCLTHDPIVVNVTKNATAWQVMELTMTNACGPLVREWRYNPPISPLAREIVQHQSNCSIPLMKWPVDNVVGMGSHIFQWSEAYCIAKEIHHRRLYTVHPHWLWMDQTHCNVTDAAQQSAWLCYLPRMEFTCPTDTPPLQPSAAARQHPTLRENTHAKPCPLFQSNKDRRHAAAALQRDAFRFATVEYMFQEVSPLVIREAQRQVGIVFGPQGAPQNLITVHIRWGDKRLEAKIWKMEHYLHAVRTMLAEELGQTEDENATAHIYLLTEDPAAVDAFVQAAPSSWTIYHDVALDELGPFRPSATIFNTPSITSSNARGRAGLVNLASLLVSLEAKYFVVATKTSNWSALLYCLVHGVIQPRCTTNCNTRIINLAPGLW